METVSLSVGYLLHAAPELAYFLIRTYLKRDPVIEAGRLALAKVSVCSDNIREGRETAKGLSHG